MQVPKAGPGAPSLRNWRMPAALLVLLLVTFAAFEPLLHNGFVGWDDTSYVTENPHVLAGLSTSGIAWAFRSIELANWHPLTWLSHMLDVSLFGLAPWGHHLTSLLFHLLNTLLLFIALRRLSGAPWRSFAVAALFALHPLHVEAVAMLGDRKDVLCTSFWFATLWAWARYAERPCASRYALVALGFALGLMSKPMLVSLPLTLLILDFWPLRRGTSLRSAWTLGVEKLPLFAMSLASSIVTWIAQRSFRGAITDTPFTARLTTAVLGYFGYLEKTLWPTGLTVFYPYRADPPAGEVAVKAAALVLISAAIVWFGRRRPYLPAGWAWYLVTLVPVIGLVRIGQQQMADRYTYVPLVGVFVMLVWGAAELASRVRLPVVARAAAALAAVLLAVALAVGTRSQAATWRDGVSLWGRALEVGGNSTVSQNNLGVALELDGRLDEAATHFAEAIRLEPRHERARRNLGNVRFTQGRLPEAIRAYEAALALKPDDALAQHNLATAHYNLANASWRAGRLDTAIVEYREATRWQAGNAGFQRALGMALLQQGQRDEAVTMIERSLALDPTNPSTHNVLAAALFQRGDVAGARREVEACRARGGKPSPWLVAELEQRSR